MNYLMKIMRFLEKFLKIKGYPDDNDILNKIIADLKDAIINDIKQLRELEEKTHIDIDIVYSLLNKHFNNYPVFIRDQTNIFPISSSDDQETTESHQVTSRLSEVLINQKAIQ